MFVSMQGASVSLSKIQEVRDLAALPVELDLPGLLGYLDKAIANATGGEQHCYDGPRVALPGYRVPACQYVEETTGELRASCIVAAVLALAGVPLAVLHALEFTGAPSLMRCLTVDTDVIRWTGSETDYNLAVSLLAAAQTSQDSGLPWGMVRECATETLASLGLDADGAPLEAA